MDWTHFLKGLQPNTHYQGNALLARLSSFQTAPDVFWYPGSGRDLTPLLLDVPNNPIRRRLYRTDQECEGKPFLYWMNDYCGDLEDFPEVNLLGNELVPEYGNLWNEYNSTVSIGEKKECYRFDRDVMITLFTANVKNREQGGHARKETGDEYLVCFSSCDSELLLRKIFQPYCCHLSIVALIRQGGFSGQRDGFGQYVDLPDRVTEFEEQVGKVDFWCIDSQGQNEELPIAPALQEYEYIGGPLPWGWRPARLYGRPGVFYSRERRSCRVGKSWGNRRRSSRPTLGFRRDLLA